MYLSVARKVIYFCLRKRLLLDVSLFNKIQVFSGNVRVHLMNWEVLACWFEIASLLLLCLIFSMGPWPLLSII